MDRQNDLKQMMLQLELNYLELLCIEEIIASISVIYIKQKLSWPIAAKTWQHNVQKLHNMLQEAEVVTELITTSLVDKFVPKGYPVETFDFIRKLKKDTKRYEALLMEFNQNRVVSIEKLLFFSSEIKALYREAELLINVFPLKKIPFIKYFWKVDEAYYFIKSLHQCFIDMNDK